MSDPVLIELLSSIDKKLTALLALSTRQAFQGEKGSKVASRTVDRMFQDAGLRGVDVAYLLNVSPQAVSNRKSADKASAAKRMRRS